MNYEQPAGDGFSTLGNCQLAHDFSVSVQEVFSAYQNRDTDDNRSAQKHLGPSEVGTPCDRRLAMHLAGRRAVNPGGDGYAAWLGTQGHRGMAEIYQWLDGNSGRFAIETPLNFPSVIMPRGTGDLLDRMFLTYGAVFIDWKFMGNWSLKKLRAQGPGPTYRVQLQTYAAGAIYRGEKVKHIVLCALPRQGAKISEMYSWSEPVDKKIAADAISRVHDIDARVKAGQPLDAFPIASDCGWCDFYMPGASSLEHGCNGKA